MERAATKTISRTAASGHGGSARSEREPQLFGERLCGINVMLDPPETRGDKQLRRRWRECARRQKNRRANRAVIVVVAWDLHRSLQWRVSERRLSRYDTVRTATKTAQVHVAKGKHDLQRQRNQRQHRTVPSMVLNPAHPQFTTCPDAMLAL